MGTMKIVVTGASGLLGRAVHSACKKAGHDVRGTAFSRAKDDLIKLDLHDEEAVTDFIAVYKPDVLIHCAAERRPDVAEADPDAAVRLNVAASRKLSELCAERNVYMIYISTDYVFPGNAPADGYDVGAKVEPTNLYGQTKADGERAVFEDGIGKTTVLRVPVLYGKAHENAESAVNILLDNILMAPKDKKAKMDNWATRYPTNVEDVANVLVQLADKAHARPMQTPPILHFSSQDKTWTKYLIAKFFCELVDKDSEMLEPVNVGPDVAKGETIRPRDCHLSNRAIEALGVDTKTV